LLKLIEGELGFLGKGKKNWQRRRIGWRSILVVHVVKGCEKKVLERWPDRKNTTKKKKKKELDLEGSMVRGGTCVGGTCVSTRSCDPVVCGGLFFRKNTQFESVIRRGTSRASRRTFVGWEN